MEGHYDFVAAQHAGFYPPNLQPAIVPHDVKPRLSKSQHEMLEVEYSKQAKPSTSTKKGFAEALGVSLDKVNNWFQNRRAKSKQDAKKAAGAYNLLQAQHASSQVTFSSDSETSPAFASEDYFSMMQQCLSGGQRLGRTAGPNNAANRDAYGNSMGLAYSQPAPERIHATVFDPQPQLPQEMFDSPQEINRRTLTQEQFDAFTHSGSSGELSDLEVFGSDFYGNGQNTQPVMPQQDELKTQHAFTIAQVPPALSSYDSSIPSTMSEHSIPNFPSNPSLRDAGSASSASSDWTGSRSSSVCTGPQDDGLSHGSKAHQQAPSLAQWQPGQSVPVDINALNREFQQAAQLRRNSQQHPQEQPLAWPVDGASDGHDLRNASILAQSLNNVELQTPQPQRTATFKTPAPPTSIAARRQRPRPAQLGLASMRSQSYSGVAQPASPGQRAQPSAAPGQPQLRRIRSSNTVGGIAQGRVQKLQIAAPQRSPLAWAFGDSVNSPQALRHVSSHGSGTVAPPTPSSPREFSRQEQAQAQNAWQSSHNVSRQPSISETTVEHGVTTDISSMPPQPSSSPPHTPLCHPHTLMQQYMANNFVAENTPPQSAPASQQTFPSAVFAVHPQPVPFVPPPQRIGPQLAATMPPPQPQYPETVVADPNFQFVAGTVPQPQPNSVAPSAAEYGTVAFHYPQGVPMVNANGQLEFMMPPQFYQQPHSTPTPPQQHHLHTVPKSSDFEGMMGMFSTAASTPPSMQAMAQAFKPPPSELLFQEYSPPADVKRSATPRRTVDSGPKNYSFANHGPRDFERNKKAAGAKATTSNSPSSAASSS